MRHAALALALALTGCAGAGSTMQGATRSVGQAGRPRPSTPPASQGARTTGAAAKDAPATAGSSASSGSRRASTSAGDTLRGALPD